MRQEKSHPSWWQLYLLGLVMVGLLVLGALAPLSERGHQAAAIGTLLLVWGLVELWLRANTAALLHINKLVLMPQPRPKAKEQMPEVEREPAPSARWQPGEAGSQPAPQSRRQPREAEGQRATEGALALQERDSTTC